ncbi:hypothetical protein FC65_GL000831 [Ligilactobacillus acidipiscis DSM 15836]|uniref:Uncharacterized protein n=1 Tax=Ligilactobacillus acidipiscis DSM 15836 TaxID=1423716 RepID=A0ABR5PI34_9LACO|nr:hypothetical protein FC65_GL000831 [Ligilactobacillus acidipiscis DSM 15836]
MLHFNFKSGENSLKKQSVCGKLNFAQYFVLVSKDTVTIPTIFDKSKYSQSGHFFFFR